MEETDWTSGASWALRPAGSGGAGGGDGARASVTASARRPGRASAEAAALTPRAWCGPCCTWVRVSMAQPRVSWAVAAPGHPEAPPSFGLSPGPCRDSGSRPQPCALHLSVCGSATWAVFHAPVRISRSGIFRHSSASFRPPVLEGAGPQAPEGQEGWHEARRGGPQGAGDGTSLGRGRGPRLFPWRPLRPSIWPFC